LNEFVYSNKFILLILVLCFFKSIAEYGIMGFLKF
jgi:hypothetical protein